MQTKSCQKRITDFFRKSGTVDPDQGSSTGPPMFLKIPPILLKSGEEGISPKFCISRIDTAYFEKKLMFIYFLFK